MELVATDGYRLSLVESQVDGLVESDGVLIPRKAIKELMRLESDLDLRFKRSDHHLSFTLGERQLICRILEGGFPNYERIITTSTDKEAIVDRRSLASVIHRVGLFTSERAPAVRMKIQAGQIVLDAANPDLGEATEPIPCDYGGSVTELGLNPQYVSDFLRSLNTQQVRLEFSDQSSRCLAYPVDGEDKRYVCVIMPIHL